MCWNNEVFAELSPMST